MQQVSATAWVTAVENRPAVIALVSALGGWSAGHNIYGPEIFSETKTLILLPLFCREHRSGIGKSAITDADGKPVRSLSGVHGLEVLRWLCGAFGLETRGFYGRGSQAEEYDRVLRTHLGMEVRG